MPLQNRVDPWGNLHAHPARSATMMGNRGNLHDAGQTIVRPWVGKAWVACDPGYKKINRKPLFQPGRYSELFFLDEATAYAAGHRPCAYCQRPRFNEFKAMWSAAVQDGAPPASLPIKEVDARLHQDRAARGGKKVVFTSPLAELPDGTLFEVDQVARLMHRGKQLRWSFEGYLGIDPLPAETPVNVLTPKSIVSLYALGLKPRVHASAAG